MNSKIISRGAQPVKTPVHRTLASEIMLLKY